MFVASPGAMGHGEIFTEPPVEPVHKVPSVRPQLGNNSAISLLRVRKHGFVAVEGPSRPLLPLANSTGCRPKDYPSAAGPSELYPGFTTVALDMPDNCSGHLVLAVNAKTSVAGFVQIGFVSHANTTDTRYRLCNSDPLRGNFLAATASWGGGSARTLPTGGGHSVQLEVILVAAKLFSLQFKCTAPPVQLQFNSRTNPPMKLDDDDSAVPPTNGSRYLPLLFIDDLLFESTHGAVSLRVQPPTVGPVIIIADRPWESWAIGGYNHAMKFGPADYRLFYACIEYNNHTKPGTSFGQIEERLCLARSADGITWHKPSLGKYSYGVHGQRANTENNILASCYEVSVFEDLNPSTQPSGRYKMLCGKAIFESPNGLDWNKTGSGHITHADDTMDTGWFDPALEKYVIYVRRDLGIAGRNCSSKYESAKNTCRLVGRCETTDLFDWEEGNPEGCPAAFGPDAEDPMGIDLYTSGFAPYEGVQLFFPAAMYSFGHSFPWGYGNDGLLDVRFAASRDGKTIRYVPGAANAREPWFELGLNRCGAHASAPDSYRGGWCDPDDKGQMSHTDPHTTTNYVSIRRHQCFVSID